MLCKTINTARPVRHWSARCWKPYISRNPAVSVKMVAGSALADTSKGVLPYDGASQILAIAYGIDGAFVRAPSSWRDQVAPNTRFPPEAGRYHLYVSLACPWACRALSTLYVKGLEDAIGVSIVHPTWQRTRPNDPQDQHFGWTFADPKDAPFSNPTGFGSFPPTECIPDTVNGYKFVRDLYDKAGQAPGGRYTVPVLWDKKEHTIVNNESSEILRILNTAFNSQAKRPEIDLYPEDLRTKIDELNEWIYNKINNGVYRSGFAQKQAAYEEAFKDVFSGLDQVEEILSKQRYIAGDRLTEADLRLFPTLIRFDPVYVVYFKCNANFIRDYPNIKGYVQELYQHPDIRKSVSLYHIKTHYFTSHPTLNHYAIVPVGGKPWWEEPHDRDTKFPIKK